MALPLLPLLVKVGPFLAELVKEVAVSVLSEKLISALKSPTAKKVGVTAVCGIGAYFGLGAASALLTVGVIKGAGAIVAIYLAWTRLSLAQVNKLIAQGKADVQKVQDAVK